MVTFSIPGDNELAEAGKSSTPRPRPPLPFAKRAYVSSPLAKRTGTPQSAPSRRLLTRDEMPSSSLNKTSIATARNIFRASSITDTPPTGLFSPSLGQSSTKKVFAPGATPEPTRVFRGSTAQASPRGMAAKTTSKELFTMRIEDPDPELSGEVLTNKIPKDWNSKGSIYADQFLADVCPPEFDDEQRRQFFCILDLRRLKYAANEIFSKKDWKLNIINFAKEFEKSRSIILLRYGLYEFQNVKPSKEVLKRWRREHGLPEPEEENAESTPTKPTGSKKRKAADDISKDTTASASIGNSKRRAMDKDDEEEQEPVPAIAPVASKNKRKASLSEDSQPQSKMQKSTPSAAKSLFEKIANKSSTTPAGSPVKASVKPAEEPIASKPNPFAANQTNGGSGALTKSVFQNLKPANAQGSGNIFGYLSDASSAKNSGVDADAESETDSDADDSQATGQSEEPSAAASGADTASQIGSALFGKKPAPTSGLTGAVSSAPGTRESTPGRSLFDRVTKDSDGQPVRAEDDAPASTPAAATPAAATPAAATPAAATPAIKPADQTWNPTTTPLKFAPSTSAATSQPAALFGGASTAPTSAIFAPKSTTSSNIFGAPKQSTEKEASTAAAEQADKTGGESDKENDEGPSKKPLLAPTSQTPFGGLFAAKPTEAPKAAEPAKTASALFGAPKTDEKPATPTPTNMFGAMSKPAESAPLTQVSSLFGAKPAESEASKPAATPLFGATSAGATAPAASAKPAGSLFGGASTTPAGNMFGGASTASTTATSLFGAPASKESSAPKTDAPAVKPFSFGAPSTAVDKPNGTAESKPLFAAPKSPGSSAPLFGGSPMKQDGPSPAKRAFTGGSDSATSSGPIFSFGGAAGGASSTPAAPIFGGASSANGTSSTPAFGAGSSTANTGSGSLSFGFGNNATPAASGTSGSAFNNPFASGAGGNNSGPSAGGAFNFGASSTPAGNSPFQFGGPSSGTSTPAFGGASQNTPAPAFGGASGAGGAPAFNFQAATPQPPQNGGFAFGSSQPAPAFGNLQPPAGGTSTTGTNTPFSLGGGSSLATTPAGGTPEPGRNEGTAAEGDDEDGEKHEQINLTSDVPEGEEVVHDVRAKALKFIKPDEADEADKDKPKPKSPWSTQGVGPLRLLRNKETGKLRLLMRAEPRGNIAMNRNVISQLNYKADGKYVRLSTANDTGKALETWMIQVKTKELASDLAAALEKYKGGGESKSKE